MQNFNVIILIGPIQNGVRGVFPGGRGFGKSLYLYHTRRNSTHNSTITQNICDYTKIFTSYN